MFNGKNIDFDEWIAKIEKVSNMTAKPQLLTLAKSLGMPYKMIFQTPSNTAWGELRRKIARSLFLSGKRHECGQRSVKRTA